MKYGIQLPYRYTATEEAAAVIAGAGFTSVILSWESPTREKDPAAARAAGLAVENLHAPFDGINAIWKPGEAGEVMLGRLLEALDYCARHEIPTMVTHLTSSCFPPVISSVGEDRWDRLVAAAEQAGVDLAMENLRVFRHLDWALFRYRTPRVGFCYDSGHERCFTFSQFVLSKFRGRLKAVHLHDNDGVTDLHVLPGEAGAVDWSYVRRGLRDYDGPRTLEVFPGEGDDLEEYYSRAMAAAKAHCQE